MDYKTNRADHIEDFLVTVRTGQWFGWSDPDNKIYANVIVYDGGSKPTEQECTDGLAQLQTEYDAQEYARNRKAEYPTIEDQLDKIYHDGIDSWKEEMILPVKNKFPKT